MDITKISDINYEKPSIISFKATVLEVQSDGDGDKKPFKALLKLEDSGETVLVSSWKFENLETYKQLVLTDEVYIFEGQAGNYGNYGHQIRVGNIKNSGLRSTKKVLNVIDVKSIKDEINAMLTRYFQPNDLYYKLIKKLIITNDKFWEWPAATKIHHAYPGGLAKHSLDVAKNAISMWTNYLGRNLDIKLLIAGALLHDIGKLTEYNADGSRTIYGNFIPHCVSGYNIISKAALEMDVDPDKDKEMLMLLHIILSHHEKLEFGAPVKPYILEAVIVSRADALDATYESVSASLSNLLVNESSEKLIVLEGGNVFKWK